MITALCGGVGGSKLALGLYRHLPPDSLSVIVNTADDLEFCGLHISPDLDTVTYTMAGIVRQSTGWGIEGDTYHALDMLARYGRPVWFQVGDQDLATHLYRTRSLRSGESLTQATSHIVESHGIRATILPATDAPVATRLLVSGEWIDFQDYFVRLHHAVPVDAIRYDGVDKAYATKEVTEAIHGAEIIIIVNSNPALSILPILAIPGVREALATTSAPCVGVSPIAGSGTISGPAGDLMRHLGHPISATGVARTYAGVVQGMVIDTKDSDQQREIESLSNGINVLCTNVIMHSDVDKLRLASDTVTFARGIR